MNIEFIKNQPHIIVGILSKSGAYKSLPFLIDTGFNGDVIIVGNITSLLSHLDFSEAEILPYESWIRVADGRKVQTFEIDTSLRFEEREEKIKILLIDSEGDKETAIFGIEFLRQNRKQLLLDFREEKFVLN